MKAPFSFDDILGYHEVKEEAGKLAKTDENILLIGESGVGKRIFASAIHNESDRKDNPFVVVEAPSIQSTLFESELFGHRKGAFTDAKDDRAGLIKTANKGTLFFDEIGALSSECQVKILRVIEERKVRRIGENIEREVDIRFIFATNQDLWREAEKGRVREDLLYRIEGFVLQIPSLRKRREEISEIAQELWKKISKERLSESKEMDLEQIEPLEDDEIEILLEYEFPGNIRQLQNILVRVFHYWKESPDLSRIEIIEKEIERARRVWRRREEERISKVTLGWKKEGWME